MEDVVYRIVTVVFRRAPGQEPVFLLMHRCLNWKGWEFPKGRIEANESMEAAVKRELWEETGLSRLVIIGQMKEAARFFDNVQKKKSEVYGFLVESLDNESVSLANNVVQEHDGFEWVKPQDVKKRLKFLNTKQLFAWATKELNLKGIEP